MDVPERLLVTTDALGRVVYDVFGLHVCNGREITHQFLRRRDEMTVCVVDSIFELPIPPNDVPRRGRRRHTEFPKSYSGRFQKIVRLFAIHVFSVDGRLELLRQTEQFSLLGQVEVRDGICDGARRPRSRTRPRRPRRRTRRLCVGIPSVVRHWTTGSAHLLRTVIFFALSSNAKSDSAFEREL